MIFTRERGEHLTEAVLTSFKLCHHLNSAYGSFIEGSVFQSWYYFVFCLWIMVSQFYQAVKWLQEAGGKPNKKKTWAISHFSLVCTGVAFPSIQLCVYIVFTPPLWEQTLLCWDPKVLTSLSLCLIIYWRKSSVCSPCYTLCAVCLWEWKMRQRAIDEILDPLKARGVLPLTCLGSQFCPESFISILYNARQLSKLMPSRFIRLTWSDSISPNLNCWHLHRV